MKFFLRLSHDVFFEAILLSDRRRLIKLERVGRRFYWISENFFKERPFLRLSIEIDPRFLNFLRNLINCQKLAQKFKFELLLFYRKVFKVFMYEVSFENIRSKCIKTVVKRFEPPLSTMVQI